MRRHPIHSTISLLLSVRFCLHQLHSSEWQIINLLLAEKPTLKDLLHVKILKHARERKISVRSEVAAFFPFRRKTIISPFIKTSMRTQMPIEIDLVDSESDDLQKAKCKETCDTNQKLPGYCSIITEKLLEHQVRGWVPLYYAFIYFAQIIWLEFFMLGCLFF